MKYSRLCILFVLLLSHFTISADGFIPTHTINSSISKLDDFVVKKIELSIEDSRLDLVMKKIRDGVLSDSFFVARDPLKVYWMAFQITNKDFISQERYIRLDQYGAELVQLYQVNKTRISVDKSGLAIPLQNRVVNSRFPVFKIELGPGESREIFISYRSRFISPVSVLIEDEITYDDFKESASFGYVYFFGAAAVFLIFNLILSIIRKEKIYLYHFFFILSFITFVLLNSGYSAYLLNVPVLHYVFSASTSLTFAFLCLFAREILQTKRSYPLWDRVIKGQILLYLISSIIIVLFIRFASFIGYLGLLSSFFLLLLSFYGLIKRNGAAAIYALSVLPYQAGVILLIAMSLQMIPNNLFTRYFYLAGALVQMTLFSIHLLRRTQRR